MSFRRIRSRHAGLVFKTENTRRVRRSRRLSLDPLEQLEVRLAPATLLGNSFAAESGLTPSTSVIGPGGGLITDPIEAFPPGGSVAAIADGMSTPTGLSPAQMLKAYGFTADGTNDITFGSGVAGTGAGQTIAIVDEFAQPNIIPDLEAFDRQFGLQDPPHFSVTNFDGTPNAPIGDWGIETSMDVEWAHAIAPQANILLVETSDLYAGVNYARQQPGVSVVSMSWGAPEFNGETSYDSTFTTPAGHTGITFVASSGDHKAGEPGDYPAFSPNVLAVGGTFFSPPLDANGDYSSETGWSDGGGGISQYERQPSYQKGVVTQSSTARTIPDVSLDAATGVSIYDSYDFGSAAPWGDEGGTSLSAPCWAGLIAIADQGTSSLGHGTLDNISADAWLYNIDSGWGSFAFHDVATGNNGYPAGPGYDLVTGLGTPKAAVIATGLSGNIATPVPIAPTGTISTTTPTFQWSAVSGALGYQLTAYDQATGAKILNLSVPARPVTHRRTPLLCQAIPIHGRCRPTPSWLASSAPSAALSFNFPQVPSSSDLSPANDSALNTTTPTFQWSAVPGAAYYYLGLIDLANPKVAATGILQVTGTSYTLSTPLNYGHSYEWYVQAVVLYNGIPYGGFSSTPNYFTIAPAGATTLQAPVVGGGHHHGHSDLPVVGRHRSECLLLLSLRRNQRHASHLGFVPRRDLLHTQRSAGRRTHLPVVGFRSAGLGGAHIGIHRFPAVGRDGQPGGAGARWAEGGGEHGFPHVPMVGGGRRHRLRPVCLRRQFRQLFRGRAGGGHGHLVHLAQFLGQRTGLPVVGGGLRQQRGRQPGFRLSEFRGLRTAGRPGHTHGPISKRHHDHLYSHLPVVSRLGSHQWLLAGPDRRNQRYGCSQR